MEINERKMFADSFSLVAITGRNPKRTFFNRLSAQRFSLKYIFTLIFYEFGVYIPNTIILYNPRGEKGRK
jgi:hypothetical protein|tara:strand:+ start:1100 stop:1309 length:210 start_codon:yes stop_codon:yes gene_type:complete